ncbi:MAG: diacylglycerol kinase family protein [Butyricicoccus sp.]|nr:diacylglycerol kinase family protein [Butyricicoccus sp.]
MGDKIDRLRHSFACAIRGVLYCIGNERNLRIHITAALYVSAFAALGEIEPLGCALLALCFGMMISAELMNTAIERLGDRASPDFDRLVRDAKDVAAGGVLVCALACVVVGYLLFLPTGALSAALAALFDKIWRLMLLILSIPAAVLFIFYFGRKQ